MWHKGREIIPLYLRFCRPQCLIFPRNILCSLSQMSGFLKPQYLDYKGDVKMMKADGKGWNCALTLKNLFGPLGPNKLLPQVLKRWQWWLEALQSRVRSPLATGWKEVGVLLFLIFRHQNTFSENIFPGRERSLLSFQGQERRSGISQLLWPLQLTRLFLFLFPSFQGSRFDPKVVPALCCSSGNAPTLHLENLSIHWVCLWAGSDQGKVLRKRVSGKIHPLLVIFGTGWSLIPSFLSECSLSVLKLANGTLFLGQKQAASSSVGV